MEDQSNKRLVVGYARESFFDQKEDLVRQKERLGAHLINTPNSLVLTGFGSGLNFKKHGLTKLLALVMAGRVKKIVITHLNELISKMTVLATALTPRLTNTYCLVARS